MKWKMMALLMVVALPALGAEVVQEQIVSPDDSIKSQVFEVMSNIMDTKIFVTKPKDPTTAPFKAGEGKMIAWGRFQLGNTPAWLQANDPITGSPRNTAAEYAVKMIPSGGETFRWVVCTGKFDPIKHGGGSGKSTPKATPALPPWKSDLTEKKNNEVILVIYNAYYNDELANRINYQLMTAVKNTLNAGDGRVIAGYIGDSGNLTQNPESYGNKIGKISDLPAFLTSSIKPGEKISKVYVFGHGSQSVTDTGHPLGEYALAGGRNQYFLNSYKAGGGVYPCVNDLINPMAPLLTYNSVIELRVCYGGESFADNLRLALNNSAPNSSSTKIIGLTGDEITEEQQFMSTVFGGYFPIGSPRSYSLKGEWVSK